MQKATRLKTAMCVLGCLGTAGHIQADVLRQYTMDSNLNPSTEAANITGTSIGALTDGTTSISYSSATPLENPTERIDL